MPELIQALTLVVVAILALVAFDLVAVRFGADSRPSLPDDHRR